MGAYGAFMQGARGMYLSIPVHDLHSTFQVLKHVMLYFSQATMPNISSVIPAMNHIDKVLETHATKKTFLILIQAAVSIGKKTLNRYYSKTDLSEIYHISMGKFSFIFCSCSNTND